MAFLVEPLNKVVEGFSPLIRKEYQVLKFDDMIGDIFGGWCFGISRALVCPGGGG